MDRGTKGRRGHRPLQLRSYFANAVGVIIICPNYIVLCINANRNAVKTASLRADGMSAWKSVLLGVTAAASYRPTDDIKTVPRKT